MRRCDGRMRWVVVLIALCMAGFCFGGTVRADYDDGVRAYNAKDYGRALKEFRAEAEMGNPDAQQALGLMYEKGRGVGVDLKTAASWYMQAADQGHDLAAVNLGILYRDGRGVARDFAKARHYLTIGAMQDDGVGQNALGALYANGQGGPVNDVEAYAWFLLAQGNGAELAEGNLKMLRGRMNGRQIEAAQKRMEALSARMDGDELDPGPAAGELLAGGGQDGKKGAGPGTVEPVDDWDEYRAKSGLRLRHPRNWKVRASADGALGLSSGAGETLIIWPFFVQGKLSEAMAGRIVASLTAKLEPGAQLQGAGGSGSAAKAVGRWGGREFACGLAWNSSPIGDAGIYTMASAPLGGLARVAPVFAKVMGTVKMAGQGSAGGPSGKVSPGVDFVRWTDPTERAFWLDVPRGWQVGGGIARFNAVDVRPAIQAVSPDGQTTVFIGDASVPSFLTPHPLLDQSGFPEGTVYRAGYNQSFLIKRYLPGQVAARTYYDWKIGGKCPGARELVFRELPETTRTINAIFQRYGLPFVVQRMDAGELAMSCDASGRSSYVFAGTFLSQMQTAQGVFGTWVLNYLHGFDAPEADAGRAGAILDHMTTSFTMNPEWLKMNVENAGAMSRIVAETSAAISQAVSSSYWNKVKVDDRLSVARSQTILGVEEAYDPQTGRRVEVKSGSNYYWIDNRGNVIGTQTDTLPHVDFRRMFTADGNL